MHGAAPGAGYGRGMSRRFCVAVTVAAALATGACSSAKPDTADDAFISDLSSDKFWKTVDRSTAITAGHDFCDAAIESNNNGKTAFADVAMVLNRYGLKSGPVLFGAAKKNYCPEVDVG